MTTEYPENRETLVISDRWKSELIMPHDENNEHACTACGICMMNCPNGTIIVTSDTVQTEEGKKIRKQLEVDFVVNRGEQRYYIQSALSIVNPEKREQEIASLIRIPDSFDKIVVVRDYIKPWKDNNGILYIGVEQFLLDENAIML